MTDRGLTRRELTAAGAGAAAAFSLAGTPTGWARKRPGGLLRRAQFPSGVMTGTPRLHGALFWTQIGSEQRAGKLRLEIARDAGFNRIVHEQDVKVRGGRDNTVLARARSNRMEPGNEYFYRFRSRTTSSPAGRFVTNRPRGSKEPVRVGFFSCQDYSAGYYTAHAGLAQENCDVIVCLGDYIYETNGTGVGGARDDATSAADSGECELLDEYRAKYRLYRSDPDLQAAQASAPLIPTWDDHEVEDNYAGTNGGKTANAPVERRIPFAERKLNGYKAFFEQMPALPTHGARFGLYRRLSLGGMLDLLVLDERQYRSDQTCNDVPGIPCQPPPPGHTLLGRGQMDWLKSRLSRSKTEWRMLATGIEMMGWDSAPGIPLNRDGWDGYPADRREIAQHVLGNGIEDITVISGDVHHFAAGVVTSNGNITGDAFATEFVGGSITSGFADGPLADLVNNSQRTNPHMAYQNFRRRGYGVMDVTSEGLKVRFRAPSTIDEPKAEMGSIANFSVPRGTPRVTLD